jgi:hypothetical protein
MSEITTNSDCVIAGDFNRCPADASITYNGIKKIMDASLSCPLDSVEQSDFIEGSQLGLCDCAVDIYDADVPPPVQILGQTPDGTGLSGGKAASCECYLCGQGYPFGVAFTCDEVIVGSCTSFNCFGECNGDTSLNFLGGITRAPTAAPSSESDAAAHLMASPMWLVGFMIARMLRH